MQHNSSKSFLFTLLTLPLLLSGCLDEDTQPQPEQSVKGRVVLNIADMGGYVDVQTRTAQPLPSEQYVNYTYTLAGNSLITGDPVNLTDRPLTELFGASPMEVEAGTYTLTVKGNATMKEASETGNGTPYYEGTSVDNSGQETTFDIHVEETTNVSVLLKPSNAKLTIVEDGTFSSKYGNATFTVGTREINLSSTPTVAYFPVGAVSYTITAPALSGSHVTDISGATGSITVEAGKAYTLTLSANPVTGELIPVVSGTHTGEFD